MNRLLLIIAFLIPLNAISQTKDTIDIEEITINAEKVGTKMQKMPVSVSYIPSKKLEAQNVNNLTELSARIPNLFMPDYGSRLTTPIFIRGIGARINSPSVGLYVDGIPYFDKGSFNFEFFNIQKIEVLRGPQGTLNGRNTMGGLIKIYTLDAQSTRSGSLYTEYGNYKQSKTVLHLNQPLGEKLAVVVDGAYTHSDGFFVNQFTETEADNFDTYSTQVKLNYKPTDKFKLTFSTNYEKNDQSGYPYAIYDVATQTASDVNYDEASSYLRDLVSSGLNIQYKADKFVINSMTSFQYMKDAQSIDQDFTEASMYFVTQDRDRNTMTQEVTIHSKEDSKLKWLAGAFAFNEVEDKVVGVDVYAYGMYMLKDYIQTTSGAALFAHATLPLGKFDLTAGIRYDYEEANLVYDYDRTMGGNTSQVDDFDNNLDFSEILPKIAINYNASENISLYSSITKGYKAGNFNSTFERDEDISFEPEYSINYEIGAKTSFLNNKLIANLAIFYIDWKDQQIYQPVPSGLGSMLTNAGHSESKGVELELSSRVNKSLELWLGMGYNEAKFLDYQRNDTTNYGGNYIPYIPAFTMNAGANYSIFLNSDFINTINLNANYQYFGKLYWNDANEAYQESYGLLNAKISASAKFFDFGLWGKNLLASDYNSFYFEAIGNSYVQLGKPVQFGLFAKIKF